MKAKWINIFVVSAALLTAGAMMGAASKPKQLPYPDLTLTTLPTITRQELSQTLGWVLRPKLNICNGYYVEPDLNPNNQQVLPLDESKTVITGGPGRFMQHGVSTLFGDVTVKQIGRRLEADRAYIYRNMSNGKIKHIDFFGNVHIREPGKLLVGTRARQYFDKHQGWIDNAYYRLMPQKVFNKKSMVKRVAGQRQIKVLNAWGRALHIEQIKKGLFHLFHASYTTCPPSGNTWKIKASKLILNKNTGRGDAYNARLYIKNMPVLYVPYFNFPIDDRRQSGFLYPGYGYSSDDGVTLTVPFYWNLAPNYDTTITPVWMNHRGVQINDLFRYLTPKSRGTIYWSWLANDHAFKKFRNTVNESSVSGRQAEKNRLSSRSANRGLFHIDDASVWSPHWSTALNLNYVTDDYYFEDFNRIPSIDTDQLLQQGVLNFQSASTSARLELTNYQTLHPFDQAILASPYGKLPLFNFNTALPQPFLGLNWDLNGQYVNFIHNKTPGDDTQAPIGSRFHLQPGVNYNFSRSYGYLTPSLKLDLAYYDLSHQKVGYRPTISRVLPIFSIHGGLYFDRAMQFFNTNYTQTLEPEIFYLLVPKVSQSNIPIFDTTLSSFSYAQMFSDNRFSGFDRFGDANQLALGVTSRFINRQTGFERFTASLGEMYYFRHRDVTICTSTGCQDKNGLNPTDWFSPIVASGAFAFNHNWGASAATAWLPDESTPVSQSFSFNYRRDDRHVFNIGYSYSQPRIPLQVNGVDVNRADQELGPTTKQGLISLVWPVPWTKRWQLLGYSDYDIGNSHALGVFYGLQYDSCCWGVRMVSSRVFRYSDSNTGRHVYDNTFYLQFILKGLGAVGNHSPGGLVQQISGYVDPYQQGFSALQF